MVGQTVEITKGESNVSLRRQRQVSLWLGDWRRMEREQNDSISVKDDFVNLHCHILRSLNFCEISAFHPNAHRISNSNRKSKANIGVLTDTRFLLPPQYMIDSQVAVA